MADKYIPKNINDITDNNENINKIINWLNISKDNKSKNGLFISGDSGVGKKTTIKLILETEGFQTKYIYYDNNNSIKNQLSSLDYLSNNNIFNNQKKIAIVIEDIDTIISSTKCSCKLFTNYLKNKFRFPFIFIYNINSNINHKLLSKECLTINFNKSSDNNLKQFVNKVCKCENITFSDMDLTKFIDILQYDYRRTLYILDNIKFYFKGKTITNEDIKNIISVFLKKNLSIEIHNGVNSIFKNKLNINKTLKIYNSNQMKLPMLVHENFIKNINYNIVCSKKEKLNKIDYYNNNIVAAYIIQSKIFETSNWDLSDYVGILSTYVPNLLLNNLKKSNKIKYNSINPSPVYSKINYRFYNLKFMNLLSKKINININNFQNFSFKIYKLFLLSESNTKMSLEYIYFLKSKKITFLDLDKTIKLSYLYAQYRSVYTPKKKREIEKLFK